MNHEIAAAVGAVEREVGMIMGGRGCGRGEALGLLYRAHSGLFEVLRADKHVLHPLVREAELALANEASADRRAEVERLVANEMKNAGGINGHGVVGKPTYAIAFGRVRRRRPDLFPTDAAQQNTAELANETRLTRAAAGKAFSDLVLSVMERDGVNWPTAWERAKEEYPAEYAAMSA